jgi:hypothetical protein
MRLEDLTGESAGGFSRLIGSGARECDSRRLRHGADMANKKGPGKGPFVVGA